MAESVQLTDLDVIARYSIAVRSATADRDELVETLRSDLAWLERGRSRSAPSRPPREADDEDYAPPRRAVTRPRATAKKTTAKKTVTRRTTR